MIVHQRNVFINDKGQRFEIPLGYVHKQGGFSSIIEFRRKVVLEFSGPDNHPVDHRNIICFDRATGEELWLIEPGMGWVPENNRNMYLEEDAEGPLSYGSIDAFYKSPDGHLWIEESDNADRRNKRSNLEENGIVALHPDYDNRELYRYVEKRAYWIRSGTHELELRNWEEEDDRTPEERGYCGMVYYADMTEHAEEDCLLAAWSNGGTFAFETALQTGKVTLAYAMIEETK